jgi:hypothetical protein
VIPRKAVLASLASLVLAACGDDPGSLTGHHSSDPTDDAKDAGDGTTAPAALQCTDKPSGRSYILFDGSKMEGDRANENVGVNRARFKPYDVMAGEYTRVIGAAPPSLAAAGGSFDAPPARWFAEASYSAVSLDAIFSISFEGCDAFTKSSPDFATAPTAATAQTQCAALMRKAWSHSASPDEIAACVDLATNKLGTEPDGRRRWMYTCAAVLSSAQFLTF